MLASIATCALGKSRRTMSRSGPISTLKRRERAPSARSDRSVLAALHPVLEHLQRHGAVVVGRFRDRPVVAFLDPGSRPARRCRAPASATSARGAACARQPVAVEQHLAEHRLRLMLALLGGKTKPTRAIAEIIPRGVRRLQIEPRQIVLRIGIAEIGRGIGEHLPRPFGIGLDLRIRECR